MITFRNLTNYVVNYIPNWNVFVSQSNSSTEDAKPTSVEIPLNAQEKNDISSEACPALTVTEAKKVSQEQPISPEITATKPKKNGSQPNNKSLSFFSLPALKKMEDYHEGNQYKGDIILARAREKAPYVNNINYVGRVLNPERRGEKWTFEKNAAFWAGGMEARRRFKIVTNLHSIAKRAEYGYKQSQKNPQDDSIWFGGAGVEMLWLNDNGYTFTKSSYNVTIATPPAHPQKVKLRKDYYSANNPDAATQIQTLFLIASTSKNSKRATSNPSHQKETSTIKPTM